MLKQNCIFFPILASTSLLRALFGPGRTGGFVQMNINEYADKLRDNWYQNRRNEWERCMKIPGNYSMERKLACFNIMDKKSHEHFDMASHQMDFD